jgi:hypothetical protein
MKRKLNPGNDSYNSVQNCDTHGEMRKAYNLLFGEPERRLRHRWKNNIKM